MNIFGLEIKKRSAAGGNNNQFLKYGLKGWLAELLSFDAVPVPVTEDSALGIAAYWRCVNLITQSIASMPIKYYTGGSRTTTEINPAIKALRHPRSNITSYTYNELLIGSALIHGDGFAIIDRSGGKIELTPLLYENVEPFIYDDEIFYQVKNLGVISSDDIIHLRGFGVEIAHGMSTMDAYRQTLGLALAAQKESLNFYAKGTKIDGIIEMPGKLDEVTKNNIQKIFDTKHSGVNSTSNTPVIDAGMSYKPIGMPPKDAQFIESNNFSNNEIATMFGVPAPMINQLERATHANIEQLKIDFVTNCLMPWVGKLEQEYFNKLLTPREQTGYFKFNVNSLMRGDSKTRAEFYRIMMSTSVMTINEVRGLEDMDPIDGGDEVMLPLNMIPISKSDEYYKKLTDISTITEPTV